MSFFSIFIYVEASKLVDLLLLQFSRQDIRRFHQFIRYFAHQNVHLGIWPVNTPVVLKGAVVLLPVALRVK